MKKMVKMLFVVALFLCTSPDVFAMTTLKKACDAAQLCFKDCLVGLRLRKYDHKKKISDDREGEQVALIAPTEPTLKRRAVDPSSAADVKTLCGDLENMALNPSDGADKEKKREEKILRAKREVSLQELGKSIDLLLTDECRKDPKKLVDALQKIHDENLSSETKQSIDTHLFAKDVPFACISMLSVKMFDVNSIKDGDGNTPLHCAALGGLDWVCSVLLCVGAEVTCLNKHNLSPLHLAGFRNHKTTCRFLIKKGFDSLETARQYIKSNHINYKAVNDVLKLSEDE